MKRVLALAALVAFLPTANAQDKAKAEITPSGEYRARYWLNQNPTANKDTQGTESHIEHRFKLNADIRANDKLSAHASLIHAAQWSHKNANVISQTSSYGQETVQTDLEGDDSLVAFYELYGNWVLTDDFSLKVGRMSYQIGDGALMGANDWEKYPNSYEGAVATYQAEFGRFQGFGFKYGDGIGGTSATSASADPEHNAYGLVFDLKTMPEWLKAVNVHFVKDAADAVVGTSSGGNTVQSLDGQDTLRYGLMGKFMFSMFDFSAWYEGETGKYKSVATGGAKTETDAKGVMYMVEAGATLDNLMASHFHVRYHMSSGSDGTDAGKHYDGYFTEQHNSAGMMDLFGWGNLTYIQLGWTGKPMDKTNVGAQYTMLSVSDENDGTVGEGSNNGSLGSGSGTDKKLGDEIDLWAEHMYDGGLSTTLRLGYFMPGDRFDNSTSNQGDAITQVMIEGKLAF